MTPSPGSTSRLVLTFGVVATTSAIQVLRNANSLGEQPTVVTPGLDFHLVVWAPVRGLAAGFDPYSYPVDPGYQELTGAARPSALRPPALLALEGLLAVPSLPVGFVMSVALNCLLLWAAILVSARPTNDIGYVSMLIMGSAVVLGGPADFLLGLGQVAAWAALGLALVLRYPTTWIGAAGVALVLVVPQLGLAMSTFLIALRYWRLVIRGWLFSALISLPFLVVATTNAGGIVEFAKGAAANLAFSASGVNAVNRYDIGGQSLGLGPAAGILSFTLVALMAWVLWQNAPRIDEVTLTAMISVSAVALYHMPYHVTMGLALGISAAVAHDTPPLVRVPIIFSVAASAISSFALFWTQRFDEGSIWFYLQPLGKATLILMPVILSVSATLEAVRRSRRSRDAKAPRARLRA